jgi:hypothetical protein
MSRFDGDISGLPARVGRGFCCLLLYRWPLAGIRRRPLFPSCIGKWSVFIQQHSPNDMQVGRMRCDVCPEL